MAREGRIPKIEINNARIFMGPGWRGFGPQGDKYGRRGFRLIIDDEDYAQDLIEWGYNIRVRPAQDADSKPTYSLPVKVRFDKYPPKVVMVTRKKGETELDDETVGQLDYLDFAKLNVTVTPSRYDNEALGNGTGVAAYLAELKVWVEESDTMSDDVAPWDDEYEA